METMTIRMALRRLCMRFSSHAVGYCRIKASNSVMAMTSLKGHEIKTRTVATLATRTRSTSLSRSFLSIDSVRPLPQLTTHPRSSFLCARIDSVIISVLV